MNGIVDRHRSTASSVAGVHDGGYHDIWKETQTCLRQISAQDPKQMLTCQNLGYASSASLTFIYIIVVMQVGDEVVVWVSRFGQRCSISC